MNDPGVAVTIAREAILFELLATKSTLAMRPNRVRAISLEERP